MIYVIMTEHTKPPSSLIITTHMHTSLRLQIPCNWSLRTPHIYSTFPIGGAFGIQSNIWGGAFCGNSRGLQAVTYFCRRSPSWMFERIPDATLSSNLLQLAEDLIGTFLSLGSHKGILESPCLLVVFIYTKHKTKK